MKWPRKRNPKLDLLALTTFTVDAVTIAVALGLFRNRRSNSEITVRPWNGEHEAPFVQVIIPARNEEDNVGPLLDSLLTQEYPQGRWAITVVDDGSTDATSSIASSKSSAVTNLTVMRAPELAESWTGKSQAMYVGSMTTPTEAEWLLFVDADTRHHPLMLSSVMQRAQETGVDLLSLIIDVGMHGFWERVIVPEVGELYTLLVGTMDGVNGKSTAAAANGQFILIKRDVFSRTGSLPEVRGDIAEDRALAAACKARGYLVRLEYGRHLVSARVYSNLRDMWYGYSKTLFWAAGRDLPRAAAVALALAFYAFAPLVTLGSGLATRSESGRRFAMTAAALQIVPQTVLRGFVLKSMGVPIRYALAYPLAVAVGDAMLLYSACRVTSGRGVSWKGRNYVN